MERNDGQPAQPLLLVLSGIPATGKSALARAMGQRLGIGVLSVDPIESAILRAGIAPGFETGLAAYLVAEALADGHLSLGQDVIVDAVNAVEPAKAMWRSLAARHGAALAIVECHCSNEALHRTRLERRQRGLVANFPEPTWEDVQRRRGEYTPWGQPLLAVDAVDSCESNVERVLAWLRQDAGFRA